MAVPSLGKESYKGYRKSSNYPLFKLFHSDLKGSTTKLIGKG